MRTILIFVSVAAFATGVSAQRAVPSHRPTNAPAEVARVNGVPLLSDRLDHALNSLLPQESFHRNVGASRLAELRAQALETIVDEELEYQAGVRLGIRPMPREVDAALASVRKKFPTAQAFDAALRQAGATVAGARRELTRSLTIDQTITREVTSRCSVATAEARRYFDQNHDRFVVPEQLHVFAITIGVDPSASAAQWNEAHAKAQDVLKQIHAGTPFENLARDMGFVHRGSLTDQLETATHNLPVGQVSDIVQTIYGFHIVRISEIRPPRAKTFGEMQQTLVTDLTDARCKERKKAWIADLRRGAHIVVARSQ